MPEQTDIKKETAIRRFRIPLRIIGVIIALSVAMVLLINHLSGPYDRTQNTYKEIIVENSDDLEDVAVKLEESGIIKDAGRFVLLNKIMLKSDFKPGMYYLSPSMSSLSISETMINGITTTDGFTIPAGYTVEQIASVLDRDGFVDKEEFLRLADEFDFSEIDVIGNEPDSDDLKGSDRIEGFLLPGEYSIDRGADEIMIIITMLNQFSNFFNDDYRARAEELDASIRQIVIIASIIEKETSDDREKADISAVLHNRFNMGLLKKKEIPDVPLCSPSQESIIAALYPSESEYTHFVLSDKLDGTHVFTDDDEEYEELLKAYEEAVEKRDKSSGDKAEDKSDDKESDEQKSEEKKADDAQ